MSAASASAPRAAFRLALLLEPRYLLARLREIRSPAEFARRFADLFVYAAYLARRAFSTPGPYERLAADDSALRLDCSADEPGAFPRDLARRADEFAAAFRAGEPFRHVTLDGFLNPDLARRLLAEFPVYDAARFRDERGHPGKAEIQRVRDLGPAFRELDDALRSAEFLELMGRITGIPGLRHDPEYFGGGTHENLDGMELDPHVDFTIHPSAPLHRRVNLMIYLNPEWDDAWGGSLELHSDAWNFDGRNRIKTITPLFNRCVMFETSGRSWHAFRRIRLPRERRGLTRRAIALYLYHPSPAEGVPAIPADLTMFLDRPLPAWVAAGRVLSAEDVDELKYCVVRRDWRLRYLYERALGRFEELRRHRESCGKEG